MSGGSALHVVHNLDDSYGGPARSIPELMHAMDELAWCSEAVSLKFHSSERNEVIEKHRISWRPLNAQIHPSLAFNTQLTRVLASGRPDLIHFHNMWNYVPLAAHRAGIRLGCPVVMSPRGNLFAWNLNKSKIKKALYLRFFRDTLFKRSAAIHATSASEVAAVKKLTARTPVALIPNGVDLEEFSNVGSKVLHKSNLDLDVEKKHILYVGRIEEKKGLAILITAFAELRRRGSTCELIVAGPVYSKSYADHCQRVALDLGVNDAIRWLGMVAGDARADVYGAADLFVLPTQSENFGMVIAEALSASVPVITTVGTPWAAIEANGAGYIIEPDAAQLSGAMKHFFNLAPSSVLEMSRAARRIAEMHGWRAPAAKMSDLYNWLLGRGGKPDFVY